MAYSSGLLRDCVAILNKVLPTQAEFGNTTAYEVVGTVPCRVTWNKGQKSLREGALDAYDTVMIRMRWNNKVTRDSRLLYNGKTYQIQSLNGNYQDNEIQITAIEII